MGSLIEIVRHVFKRLGRAPGKSIVVQATASGGQEREIEYYQLPGYAAGPTPEDRGVAVRTGTGRVVVASHNYRVEVDVEAGETAIYSTGADGSAVVASVRCKPDGTIEINGDTKRLVTYAELNTALQGLVTTLSEHTHISATSGSPTGPMTPTPSLDISAAETTTVKTGG